MSDRLLRWHDFGGPVWLHLGLILLLLGVGWWIAAGLSRAWRRPLRLVAGFSLLEGVGLLLVSFGAATVAVWPTVLGHALVVPAYVVLWRACCVLIGSPQKSVEQALNLGLGLCGVLWLGLVGDSMPAARALSWLCNVHVALRGAWQVGEHLQRHGQQRLGWASKTVGVLTGLPLALGGSHDLAMALAGNPLGPPLSREQGSAMIGHLTTLSAMAMNILIVHHVFGRLLKAQEQLRQADAAPLLHGRDTVVHLLQEVVARRAPHRAAVVALTLREHDGRAPDWGPVVTQAVQAELALLLRLQLLPGELLAHGEAEVLLLGLPDASEVQAEQRLQRLRQVVAADVSLDPYGRGPLVLGTGLAVLGAGDAVAARVAQVIARCRAPHGGM